MKTKFDTIIVGGGISGLVCGCYLAKNGVKTLIVEKNDRVGGCYISFSRGNFLFDGGAQIVGSCNKEGMLRSVLDSLGVKLDFIKLSPSDSVHFPRETIEISNNIRNFIFYLENRFPDEKHRISDFFHLLETASEKERTLYIMKKYAFYTYQQLLDSYFKDNILKSILSAQSGCLGLPPKKLSAVSAIFLLKTFIIDGAYYPNGGAQKLGDAITERFTMLGGTLFLNSQVERILVKSNNVRGILLNGREIQSNIVVSACDLNRTYKKLISKSEVKNKKLYRKLTKFSTGSSCCILYLGLTKGLDLRNKNGWYYPSYDVNKDFQKLINIHIPTNFDNKIASKGNDILIATIPFDIKNDHTTNRKQFKQKISERLLERIEYHIPNIRKHLVMADIATPLTIERYTSNSGGSLYGWNQTPDQTHMNCFPSKSSIDGLFHTGHWTLPGGGIVAVAVSGVNAAKKILKFNNNSRLFS